ncbi:PDZ and LIM domain protein Zasp isoform X3 [Drosophila novamexicana]|uniref:PDZ and LIM domain protein Zasp isoform X3 n=1 Tax=Drosophila novamexicana TaxID=47314 RepID=UPI0011E5F06E|nr:PDZ and LIM domain protein Zasp isoform X3 [Drosophila novamexicana]
MDFLSNLIKRPNSIVLPETEPASAPGASPSCSSSAPTAVPSSRHSLSSSTAFITLAMDRCSIDPELDSLFDSAAQDLDSLERQHKDLIDHVDAPVPCPDSPPKSTNSTRETIKQLLSEINFNLDQVTAREMEHLQAMSLELSPLAVKPGSARHNLEQQKALVVAMRSTSQPSTPRDKEQPLLKFTGLPEFDETQIPELAPLSVEMEAQLKADACAPVLSSTTLKLSEHEYNSDSDVYAECLSLNSGKLSADQSELEAYSSALNDVLEHQQLSNATATTLENTLSDAAHNDSCEPMDVDDINETMELLKDVLAPEDRQQLQQQLLDGAMQQQEEAQQPTQQRGMPKVEEQREEAVPKEQSMQQEQPVPKEQSMQQEQSPKLEQSMQKEQEPATSQPIAAPAPISPTGQTIPTMDLPLEQLVPTASDSDKIEDHTTPNAQTVSQPAPAPAPLSPPLPTHQKKQDVEQPVPDSAASAPLSPLQIPEAVPVSAPLQTQQSVGQLLEQPIPPSDAAPISPTLQAQPGELLPTSPPIPTHRMKTPEELVELLALQAYAQPPEEPQQPADVMASAARHVEELQASPPKPVATVAPVPKQPSPLPALELNIGVGSQDGCSGPTSPSFPVRSPAESPRHFPRSPHAPAEQEEMQYLEQANIEPAAEPKLCLSGVIARSPLPIQLTVTGASPEGPQQQPLPSNSPLNGTFDSASPESIERAERPRATFGVPLNAAGGQQRLTFSVSTDRAEQQAAKRFSESQAYDRGQEENQLNATYGTSLQAAREEEQQQQQRRTFFVEDLRKEEEQQRGLGSNQMRRTFCMEQDASPALEATEENIMADDLEPMDVDQSIHNVDKESTGQLAESQAASEQQEHQPQLEQLPIQLKRPSIHSDVPAYVEEQRLSVKEQLSAGDEKEDVYVDHFGAMSPISDDIFKQPQCIGSLASLARGKKASVTDEQFHDAEFHDGASNNNSSNNAPIDRSSLLLKFDPLLGAPVPVNQSQQQQQQQEQALLNILSNNNNLTRALSPTLEEHETSGSNQSLTFEPCAKGAAAAAQKDFKPPVDRTRKHAKMSVDVIDNDCNKTFDNSNLNSEDKTNKYNNMDELEKKIKNEVTRSEDIEKKLKDAEQREEALVKRITEKDKTNAKLNGVIEAYEKAIAELIHDKEQLVQNHERQMLEVQTDRDSNYHHLTSLETTFSDLHVKYEKSKEMTSQLKQIEENLLEEKKKLMDKLRQQEQRYEQMKSHAMQQMEIANKKMATLTKEHTDEVKKLKALLKKEEVSRISTAEQLQQKSRENADLLKICEELIYDKGQGGSS